ncbi:MAG: DUF1761 domain-containing protein [Actinomycetota bacterium]|jgi:hypothetical protein
MSFDTLGDVNYLAVLVAAVAWWILGAIWYARPVFGNAWIKASGITIQEGQRPGPETYIVPLIVEFIAVTATAMIARATVASTVGDGIVLGLVVGIGFAVALTANEAVFSEKPQKGVWYAITASYNLVGLVGAAVIVTVWD